MIALMNRRDTGEIGAQKSGFNLATYYLAAYRENTYRRDTGRRFPRCVSAEVARYRRDTGEIGGIDFLCGYFFSLEGAPA